MMRVASIVGAMAIAVSACGKPEAEHARKAVPVDGAIFVVNTQSVPAQIEATGTAEPIAEATVSTKLMATVTAVRVREGDRVSAGQVMALLDARDLTARDEQISANIAAAEAAQQEARTHAQRMRALHAEDAAPQAQLDAAEAALARANAAAAGARAGAAEIRSMRDYSVIRAPFDGVVTRRFVDPGAFAAPGTPLLTIEDARKLRIRASGNPQAVRALQRGATVAAEIEDIATFAVVEGVVPAGGSLYTVNAIVDNAHGTFLSGGAASLWITVGTRAAVMIPEAGLRRQGDVTGVLIARDGRTELRWVKAARPRDGQVEILAGLRSGEKIVVPHPIAGAR